MTKASSLNFQFSMCIVTYLNVCSYILIRAMDIFETFDGTWNYNKVIHRNNCCCSQMDGNSHFSFDMFALSFSLCVYVLMFIFMLKLFIIGNMWSWRHDVRPNIDALEGNERTIWEGNDTWMSSITTYTISLLPQSAIRSMLWIEFTYGN